MADDDISPEDLDRMAITSEDLDQMAITPEALFPLEQAAQAAATVTLSAKPAESSPASRRKQRYRRRQRDGRIVLRIEACDYELTMALIASGYLDEAQSEDRRAVSDAASRVLAEWSEMWNAGRVPRR